MRSFLPLVLTDKLLHIRFVISQSEIIFCNIRKIDMNRFWQVIAISGLAAVVASCNSVEATHNIENVPVPVAVQRKFSTDSIGKIISAAAFDKGWIVDQDQQGVLHAKLKWNNHSAEAGLHTATSCLSSTCATETYESSITITYTQTAYSIDIDPVPTGSLPEGVTYHQFNKYIAGLSTEIDKRLSQAALK
jgi:hypothetical protein